MDAFGISPIHIIRKYTSFLLHIVLCNVDKDISCNGILWNKCENYWINLEKMLSFNNKIKDYMNKFTKWEVSPIRKYFRI